MGFEFNTETFRDDFTFRNSPRAVRRFPFPFPEDSYMYSVKYDMKRLRALAFKNELKDTMFRINPAFWRALEVVH